MDAPVLPSRAAPGRSCVACKRRKIKCDRGQPCSYCTRIHVHCVYPDPTQDGGKQPENDVLSTLKRVETSLQRLESHVLNSATLKGSESARSPVHADVGELHAGQQTSSPRSGRLVSEAGDTRYVTNSFWADLDEIEKDNAAAYDQPSLTPDSVMSRAVASQQYQPLVFGSMTSVADSQHLHPAKIRIFALWQVFLDSVDPILKIIHVPTTQRGVLRASQNLAQVPPEFESLMFSIYYAAVTSMQYSVSFQTLSQEERQMSLNRYRLGMEQALCRANFMSTPDVTTLQALTIYLICARQSIDKAYIWSMTGLLIRLAMKLGLHRDPVALGLPPFLAEMRRRLWWQITILDIRTAEDNDMDPFICEHVFDTKLPANVNDADLDVNMLEPPPAAQQRTEMLFTLIRFEGSYAARKLVFSPKFTSENGYPNLSSQEKNEFVDSRLKDFEEKYLRYCDSKIPICFLTVTSIRMVLAKVKLTINHPARNGSESLSDTCLNELVQSSIEIIEYANTLRTSDKYCRWVWLFQKYIEWDAVAFLLHSLIAVPLPNLLDRAWVAIEAFFNTWEGHVPDGERRWRRLEDLRSKAATKQARERVPARDFDDNSVASGAKSGHAEGGIASVLPAVSRSAQLQTPCDPGDQHHMPIAQSFLPQNPDPITDADHVQWNFDNVPYISQGASNWDMEVDESTFSPCR